MVLMGILGLVGYVITYFTVQENIRDESLHTAEKGGGSYLRVLGKNKPFISVCLASLGMLLGNMTSMAMMVYYFEENLNNLAAMGIASVLGLIPALLIAPFLSRLVKRYSLKKVVSISSLLSAAAFWSGAGAPIHCGNLHCGYSDCQCVFERAHDPDLGNGFRVYRLQSADERTEAGGDYLRFLQLYP